MVKGFYQFYNQVNDNNVGLFIIGEGEQLSALRNLAQQYGIEHNIIFTGFKENPYPYLLASDVFLLCSKNEGISNAILEAMYLKNAIISSNSGGITDLIHHGEDGFILNNDNPELISNILLTLYKDRSLKQRVANKAHSTIVDKFSLQRMALDITDFCESVLSQTKQ